MSRRDGRPSVAPSGYPFATPQPKGKAPVVAVIGLVVIVGFFLQLNWMQSAKRNVDIPANGFADRLGRWMLKQKGVETGPVAGAPGVETLECDRCFGTGGILSADGQKREICPICLGVGSRLIRRLDSNDDLCPACGGMGRWESPDTGAVDTCPRCQGRGLVRRSGAAAAAE